MKLDTFLQRAMFVIRCSSAAALAFLLGTALALPHPIWASITGIVVSQEKLTETDTAVVWQVAGTVLGVIVAVIVGTALQGLNVDMTAQIGCTVAVSAIIVQRFPLLKVSMWTGPLVFMTRTPDLSLLEAGMWRGTEVLLGGLVGAVLHWLAEATVRRLGTTAPHPVVVAHRSRRLRLRRPASRGNPSRL